jgi:hypothetical protein
MMSNFNIMSYMLAQSLKLHGMLADVTLSCTQKDKMYVVSFQLTHSE